MNSLPRISIRNPVFAWMLMFFLIVFGAICFNRMGISQLPDVDLPVVSVQVTLGGAAPEIMETTVVDTLEGALTSVDGLKNMSSSSKTGSATITLEFDVNRNIDLAMQDVQAKVSQAQKRLPKDIDPPTVSKTNPEDQPIVWVGVTSTKMSTRDLMIYVRDQIKDQFTVVPGVADVFLGGYVDPSLRIWVDPAKLNKYALTVQDIVNTVTQEHNEPPAGHVDTGPSELNIRTYGEAETEAEFNQLRINTRGGAPNYLPIRLNQAVGIEAGLDDIRRISRVNGDPAVGMGIRKQRGVNAVEVADRVMARIAEVKKSLPEGTDLKVVFDNTTFIRESVHELNFTLIVSALLTSVVCFLFLGSFASTLNILLAIPTSIVGTFIILYFSGFTLNTFTLMGLSLAIGIVVDDAIMVLENIIRHREMGKTKVQAAGDGATEIYFAAMAASFSIAAIFLPVAFMKGVIGKYFYQFGVTMTGAVMLSLLEAITLTPMRASQMIEDVERHTRLGLWMDKLMNGLTERYRRGIAFALNHRVKILLAAFALFGVSLGLTKLIDKEMLPPEDQSRFMIRMMAPVGSSLQYTDGKMKEAEKILKSIPELRGYFLSVGGMGGGDVNTGMFFVTLKPKGDRPRSQFAVMDEVRKRFAGEVKGIKAFVQDLSARAFGGGGKGYTIEFAIQGPDWDKLADTSQKIIDDFEKSGSFVDVDTDYLLGMPEVQVRPERTKAADRGVSIQAIGDTINSLLSSLTVGYYTSGGHRNEIIVKMVDTGKKPAEAIKGVMVRNNRGELVPLLDVVSLKEARTLQQINRYNRTRAVSIYCNVKPGAKVEEAVQLAERLARKNLPEGYSYRPTGSSSDARESFESLFFALLMGIVVAYMILGAQFNSFIDPITVLLALPFSVSGAFLGLWATHKSLNMYSYIGLILLMGIVKKNSILLVDFTNQVRDQGEADPTQALLKACPTRLRPILMTSIATVVGAIPVALSFGPGAESRSPMAVAVICGVLLSTFLTLFVVPCFYSLMTRKRRHIEV